MNVVRGGPTSNMCSHVGAPRLWCSRLLSLEYERRQVVSRCDPTPTLAHTHMHTHRNSRRETKGFTELTLLSAWWWPSTSSLMPPAPLSHTQPHTQPHKQGGGRGLLHPPC